MEALTVAGAQTPRGRPRRLRRTAALRDALGETTLRAAQLVHPLFVRDGSDTERPIASMPGHAQRTVDRLDGEVDDLAEVGVRSVLLFGIPDDKDESGTGAWDPAGPVPRAIAEIKRRDSAVIVIADVCLCEYTSHGHCGVLDDRYAVANDATLPLLARAAVAYADAGADIVAPSAMMDGQVAAIRSALDDAGHADVAILAYAVKYASAFYGPFRDAAQSAPAFGDRRAYQMAAPNAREALREAKLDEGEGADMLMVKPAGPYLDIIHRVRETTDLPLAAYQVSGEYAMLKAAAERGWIDEPRAAMESLLGIRRAGADLVITYYAKAAARWLNDGIAV
ncbi:MAG TPA: porphobilinogen synthase [Gemmatimonadaceae bacterium]|nr:porphobilinogen synthase [Gemmatimonadaceae bacterium]